MTSYVKQIVMLNARFSADLKSALTIERNSCASRTVLYFSYIHFKCLAVMSYFESMKFCFEIQLRFFRKNQGKGAPVQNLLSILESAE